ncbi:uncharacterized protein [Amphiura filiformis]|uniref:uncharacterized protein n=1 Tax=Amphiura filiformis TaxID=82378 RepID=UPI003B226824
MSQKELLYSHLGELAVNGLTPTTTKIVFTEDEVKKSCGQKYLDQARGMGILCRRGEHALQFFHKSGQEVYAGNYLQNNHREVTSYLQNINTVEDALSIAPVLIFASRSNIAAKLIMQKLLTIFESEIAAQKYYDEQLSLDDSRPIQQYIELCLECNFEADAKAKFVSILRRLFVDGNVLFHGISSKTAIALAYFMSYCDPQAISDITLRPVAHVSDPNVGFGLSRNMFNNALRRMKYLSNDKIQLLRESFVASNPDLHEKWISVYSHAELAAYISCIQAYDGLPSSSETNTVPIIHSFKNIKLKRLNIDYFKLGSNFDYLLESIEEGNMQLLLEMNARSTASTQQQITKLVSSLHKMPLLRVLDISYNKAEAGKSIPILANKLNQCKSLQVLYLMNMEASSHDMELLAQNLPSQLIGFDIRGNWMSDAVASHLIGTLPHNLTHLYISVNNLSKSKHNELLHSIHSKLTRLQELTVNDSPYPGDLVKHGGFALVSCTHLYGLRLHSSCNDLITEDCVAIFMQGMQQARNIKTLRLYGVHLDMVSFHELMRLSRLICLDELGFSRLLLPEGVQLEELDDFVVLS